MNNKINRLEGWAYKDRADAIIDIIMEETDIYSYIVDQIEEGNLNCCFYYKKEDCNGKKIYKKHFIAVGSDISFYECQMPGCKENGSIIDWPAKYFNTSFKCALESINQYYGFNFFVGLNESKKMQIIEDIK
jgi:ribonucleotide reductase beta subunit family protein with ferritin-like domain